MKDILCIYYSRTGNTKKAMEEIAEALDAELLELRDGVEQGGLRGWLRCGRMPCARPQRPFCPFRRNRVCQSTGW